MRCARRDEETLPFHLRRHTTLPPNPPPRPCMQASTAPRPSCRHHPPRSPRLPMFHRALRGVACSLSFAPCGLTLFHSGPFFELLCIQLQTVCCHYARQIVEPPFRGQGREPHDSTPRCGKSLSLGRQIRLVQPRQMPEGYGSPGNEGQRTCCRLPPPSPSFPASRSLRFVLLYALSLSTSSLSAHLISALHFFLNALCLNSVKLKHFFFCFPTCAWLSPRLFFFARCYSAHPHCLLARFCVAIFLNALNLFYSVFWPTIFVLNLAHPVAFWPYWICSMHLFCYSVSIVMRSIATVHLAVMAHDTFAAVQWHLRVRTIIRSCGDALLPSHSVHALLLA
jgi:hypothetical protein